MQVNDKGVEILCELRKDARKNISSISKTVCMPISTVFDRIRDYEKSYIKRHTSLIDFTKLGFDVRVNVAIKADTDRKQDLQRFITHNQNVNSVYKINNGFDFMVEAIFRNSQELQVFLDKVDDYARNRQEFFIAEDLKREDFLTNRDLIGLL